MYLAGSFVAIHQAQKSSQIKQYSLKIWKWNKTPRPNAYSENLITPCSSLCNSKLKTKMTRYLAQERYIQQSIVI